MSDEGTATDNDNVIEEKEVGTENETVTENKSNTENQNVTENESDEKKVENEDDAIATVENGNVTQPDDGSGDVENEQPQDTENNEIEESTENNEQPSDLFDSLKDTVDGTADTVATTEEPMEVDEVSNESESEIQEKQTDTTTINSNVPDETTTNDENNETNEITAHDENDANEKIQDKPTEMEVDCETPQGEDVPDFSKKTDDSVMEHNVEQFNCSNVSDTVQKDQTISDDPFDSLLKGDDSTANAESTQNDVNLSTTSSVDQNDEQNDVSNDQTDIPNDQNEESDDQHDADDNNDADDHMDADETVGSDREDDDHDTNSHHDGSTIEAVDDIEEGKGADEELCLLPDEEREISDADKERALQNQQQADEHDDQENENETEASECNLEGIEENGEKEPTEGQTEDQESEAAQEQGEQAQIEMSIPFTPSVDEIKEIDADLCEENLCMECGQTIKCKYALLKEITPSDGDTDTVVRTEIQYLCDTGCVTKFNSANAQYKVVVKKVSIFYAMDTEQKCESCEQTKSCRYRYKENTDVESFNYICEDDCLNNYMAANPDKFTIAKKRFIIEEASGDDLETENKCLQCLEKTKCKYTFKEDEKSFFLCSEPCLNLLMAEQPDRFRFKRQSIRAKDFSRKPVNEAAVAPPKRTPVTVEKSKKMVARTEDEQRLATLDREASFARRCAQCYSDIMLLETNLQWEALDFCNEACLGQYQHTIGAACQSCQNAVSVASMGKYCVRFGFELRQFCRSACLDAFKKGLKVCSYCQLDITKHDEFLVPINGQFKDFCSKKCMRSYEQIFNNKKVVRTCAVCNNSKPVRVEVVVDSNVHYFCSNPCFSAFSFVNNVNPDCCAMCRKYFERKSSNAHTIYQGNDAKLFCSKVCMNIYIISNRKIAPCQWCKVRKYNFDMIQKVSAQNGTMMLCSINCLSMCEVSMNAIAMKQLKCDQCNSMTTPQYHLTMSDASMRNFCTYQCVMAFQSQFSRAPLTLDGETSEQRSQPVPTGLPKRIRAQQQQKNQQPSKQKQAAQSQSQVQAKNKSIANTRNAKTNSYQPGKQVPASNNLVISSVTSLATPPTRSTRRSNQAQNSSLAVELNRLQPVVELEPLPETVIEKTVTRPVGRPRNQPIEPPSSLSSTPQVRVERQTQIVTIPPLPKKVANIATMCAPSTHNKEIQARPMQFTVGCQTDDFLEQKMVIPIPVPIYVPSPLPMYAQPFPVPVPIPLPIPVPVFIPTTRNSANGIMKEIKKIQDKMPADPFEAELLMMAEMVAGDKKKEDETDSSEEENDYQTEDMGSGNNFGEDIMQMALKMATEYDPAGVDLEASMQANTITPHSHPGMHGHDMMHNHQMMMMEEQQRPTRKRGPAPRAQRQPATKRPRRGAVQEPPQPEPPREPIEKADANMCLKFTFGVNAWKQWVITKNSELEKSSMRRKLFKTELLQLTADELNYSLCLFVKEVRKPNGSEYAPDTIYYLVLGIQEYLYENGRIDNIFTDPYYERFTDCLDEVARKFSVLYNDSQYIVTRVEEEHLWECKQLGAHSPHVLLSTLMFFNTKYFNLTTVEEHMQLSFSHIMKHWKRNPNQGSAKMAGSRNVLLRFYPPQSSLIDNSRKKKVYEQQENEENPLRCPVKLYEFYLSKCPESVKTRNDVFYLLPERSCVPDSPVWYSTQALGKEALAKMLHRVKMVKEINIALLTS